MSCTTIPATVCEFLKKVCRRNIQINLKFTHYFNSWYARTHIITKKAKLYINYYCNSTLVQEDNHYMVNCDIGYQFLLPTKSDVAKRKCVAKVASGVHKDVSSKPHPDNHKNPKP